MTKTTCAIASTWKHKAFICLSRYKASESTSHCTYDVLQKKYHNIKYDTMTLSIAEIKMYGPPGVLYVILESDTI